MPPITPKTLALLKLIADLSATPDGFFTRDAKAMQAEKNAAKLCRRQFEAGTLFRARANQSTYAYFSRQALAAAYMVRHRETVLAKAATTISFAPKAARPRNPAAPKASAMIIWPAKMPECRMMPDRYAVTVPFQRIGTSSWVTL